MTPPRPPWFDRVASLGGWRGADGAGVSLARWLIAVAASWLLALLFMPLEPALILLPPMLSLAVLLPGALALWDRCKQTDRTGRRALWLARLEMPLAMAVLAAVGWGVFGPMWQRGMLIDSGDHQFMMGRAQIFYEGLRHGHWQHWTHLWQGGDTITDLYPIEANLITALVHLLAPRGTPFVVSYTVFVLWAWWLRGVGVYYLARRFSSPLIAIVLAGVALFDVGKDVNGGIWLGALLFGMIHNALALTFGLFATALQVDLTRKVTSGRFVACVLLVALTACGHALGMVVMVISTFALAIAIYVGRGDRRRALWALGASCLGLALSAVWLIPFSKGLAIFNYRVATSGASYGELGQGFLDGTLPTSSFAGFLGLTVVAAIVACFVGEIPIVGAGIASLLLVILVLTQFLVGSRFLDYVPAFLDGQPYRMLTVFKTTVVPCVAWLLQGIAQWIPAPSMSLGIGKVLRRTFLLSLILFGLGRSVAGGIDRLAVDLRAQISHTSRGMERSNTGADYQQVFDWLKERRQQDPSPTPWRAAILFRSYSRHATWTEGMNTGVPIVDPNQVPSNFLNIRPREISARGFNDWNVRYAITDYDGPPFPGSTLRFGSGRFHVWEVDGFDDRYVVAPSGVTVSDIKLDGESIRMRVDGAPSEGVDLQLRTAAYPRWRARQGDRWLPVFARLPRPDSKPKQEQLVIHAGNGPVTLTCDGTLQGYWWGLFVTICAGVAIALAASSDRRRRFEELAERIWREASHRAGTINARISPQRIRVAAVVGLVLVVGAGVAVRIRGTRRLAPAAIEGISQLSVRWRGSDGRSRGCLPIPWVGMFLCDNDGAVVDNWLGTTGPGDDSGEFAALWPGIRVATHDAAPNVILDFGRVRLDAPRGLWLQTAGWGGHHLTVTWGDLVLGDLDVGGEQMHQFPIPPDLGGTQPLKIEIRARGGATIVLRGGAGPAPHFR
jgi:hypothetical protein